MSSSSVGKGKCLRSAQRVQLPEAGIGHSPGPAPVLQKVPLRPLVMDDDAGDRRQLSRLLSRGELQAELTQADGPENALGLGTAHFDAILLDNHMPTLNGIDLLRDLRRKWPYGAVIMMAGQSNEEVAKHAILRGATDYVPKEQLCKNALLRVLQNGVAFARAGTH